MIVAGNDAELRLMIGYNRHNLPERTARDIFGIAAEMLLHNVNQVITGIGFKNRKLQLFTKAGAGTQYFAPDFGNDVTRKIAAMKFQQIFDGSRFLAKRVFNGIDRLPFDEFGSVNEKIVEFKVDFINLLLHIR